MRPIHPVSMVRRSTVPTESKTIEQLVQEGIEMARKTQLTLRREDLVIAPERIQALRQVLEQRGGQLTWPLEYAVEFLGLSPSYLSTKKSSLMASSLSRRLSSQGIRVGAHDRGAKLVFKFRTERKHKG